MSITPNQKMNLGFGLIWLGGAAFGSLVTKFVLDKKYKEQMAFAIETLENTYEAAVVLRDAKEQLKNDINAEVDKAALLGDGLVKVEDGTIVPLHSDLSIDEATVQKDYVDDVVRSNTNPYHTAVATTLSDNRIGADETQDFGVSYIEAEEYQEEDGRHKIQIDIMMSEDEPIFVMDGVQIEDWDRRIGDSILVDMYAKCPPGTESILYVRNHRTDEDYEVVLVTQP